MGYREVGVVQVVEVLRRWQAKQTVRAAFWAFLLETRKGGVFGPPRLPRSDAQREG